MCDSLHSSRGVRWNERIISLLHDTNVAWCDRCCSYLPLYINRQKWASPLSIWNFKKMLLALLFASTLAIGVLSLKPSSIDVQTDKRAESDWIKSLIFGNTKGTITLDSSALKLLMELSSSKYISKIKFHLKLSI